MFADAPDFLFYSQLLNEIMPMIYRRFTEKSAEEWRQIYKVCMFLRPWGAVSRFWEYRLIDRRFLFV